jgi:hypothetical protein
VYVLALGLPIAQATIAIGFLVATLKHTLEQWLLLQQCST